MQQDSSHPTGVTGDGQGVVRARERKANSAVQMKLAGATWGEIAEVLGYPTERAALVATEQALEKQLQTMESQSEMRRLAMLRLERLLRSVWSKGINGEDPEHLAANARASALIAQYTKLFGLDAPSEMVVHSPTATEIERFVSVVQQANTPALEEADIFDVEVVEDSSESEVV
jgi:hypothetical protein